MRVVGSASKGLLTGRMARGCDLCFPGAKTVVFVTGVCDDSCFYCPVSREKLGHDVFYVNEEPVSSIEEAVVEIERSGALGISVTGGDPLAKPDRVIALIRAVKEALGPWFHVHLYTSGRYATPDLLKTLWRAGLDEIRFHPTDPLFVERISLATRVTGMKVGAEIPIAPGMEDYAIRVIRAVEKAGGYFVNLNEMEFVEPNAQSLAMRGFRESKSRPFTVEGALEAGIRVVEWASKNSSVPVHFCPAPFKDSIQTRNRLARQAALDSRWYETPTGEGTLLWGELRNPSREPPEGLAEKAGPRLFRTYPDERLLKKLEEAYGGEAVIVEGHPTRTRRPIVAETRI
ncbi:MAG: radical SAM protein [Desulfurococcales archaeon]|nr:radical SAM protein [Desulfurococcales archaeon]